MDIYCKVKNHVKKTKGKEVERVGPTAAQGVDRADKGAILLISIFDFVSIKVFNIEHCARKVNGLYFFASSKK